MMIDRAFIRRAALIFASVWSPLLSAGCSDSTAGPEPVSPCASMRDACLVDQKVCAVGPEGPRCESCAPGTYASKAGTCDAIGGTPIAHDFADFSVKAGEEIENLCQSWTLNNPTELWVNGVELSQDVVSHHSNWTWVPADQFE